MTRRFALVVLLLAALAACGGGGGRTEVAATGSPSSTAPASPGSGSAADLGCDFAEDFPTPDPNVGGGATITQEQVDRTVAATPSEIRADMRLMMETLLQIQTKSQELERAPADQRAQGSQELMAMFQRDDYLAAGQRVQAYMVEHCPGLRNLAPSPSS